jgi:hypothetical protein
MGTMIAQAPFWVHFSDAEAVIRELTENITTAGLRVVKTFDLHAACATLTDNLCPHHLTEPCDCQLVVLQVYGIGTAPVSLILHSHSGRTEVQWDTDPESRASQESRAIILQAMSGVAGLPLGRVPEELDDVG